MGIKILELKKPRRARKIIVLTEHQIKKLVKIVLNENETKKRAT